MSYLKISVIAAVCLIVSFTPVFAGEGDPERGKKLFNDPGLGGSANQRSCNTCHPDGEGLEKVAEKLEKSGASLEDAVNGCIKAPLKGNPIDKDSRDMEDIVAYIKSLSKK